MSLQISPNSAISTINTPSGNIVATTVQAALNELDSEKQNLLISGTTIKTINNNTVLGSGNLEISGSELNSFFMAGW